VRRRGGAVACTLAALLVAACSGGTDDTLHWYVATDDFGASSLAATCSDVEVEVHELPQGDADRAHTELIRRLQGDGASVDVLTLPGSAVPELAAAGLLHELPATVTDGVLPAVAAQVTHEGDVYAAPWLFDPYLLWYRSVAAERAGIDMSVPVTWDSLISGAERLGVTIQITDDRNTGLAEWVTAMGGDDAAAGVVEYYSDSDVGPGPSETAVSAFAGSQGGFLIAPASTWSSGLLAPLGSEYGVAAYPIVDESTAGNNPGESEVLAISADSTRTEQARALLDCLTDDETVSALVAATGHAPARDALLGYVGVTGAVPTNEVLTEVLPTAVTVPVSEHWNAIRRAIDATWLPLESVTLNATPQQAAAAVEAAEQGTLP